MNDYEINKLVDSHSYIGSEQLQAFKKIIQKTTYPQFNDSVELETAKDAIKAFIKTGGCFADIVELTVFFLECGVHFSADFGGDMGEEFYTILEDAFEELLKKLKDPVNKELLNKYTPRLKAIVEVAHESGYGHGDQLEDYWQDIIGV